MSALFRYFLSALAILIVGAGIAYHVLLNVNEPVPDQVSPIDVDKLRALATSQGPLPTEMNRELIARSDWPRKIVLANDNWGTVTFEFSVFTADYPDGSRVLIDTAFDREISKGLAQTAPVTFFDEGYARLQQAIDDSKAIVLTHEHMDHIGGLAVQPTGLDRAHLTPAQKNHPEKMLPAHFPAGTLKQAQTYDFNEDNLHLVAPGIVAYKADGHSPGSQMVFARLQDGREFLFVGDIVWNMDGIRNLTSRPILISSLFLEENRENVAAQIAALHQLTSTHPDINLVVAHDYEQISGYVEAGLVGPNIR